MASVQHLHAWCPWRSAHRIPGTGCNGSQHGCWILYKSSQGPFKLLSHLSSPSKQLINIFYFLELVRWLSSKCNCHSKREDLSSIPGTCILAGENQTCQLFSYLHTCCDAVTHSCPRSYTYRHTQRRNNIERVTLFLTLCMCLPLCGCLGVCSCVCRQV